MGFSRGFFLVIIIMAVLLNVEAESQLAEANCGKTIGCFRYPAGCTYSQCEHFLMWNDTSDQTVDFSITAKIDISSTGPSFWTAIGFSNDTSMPGTPVVDCIYWNESIVIQSSYNPAHRNDVLNQTRLGLVNSSLSGSFKDNLLECSFVKYKTVSANNSEAEYVANLTESNRFYLLLPIGPTNVTTGEKYKHQKTPVVSATAVSFSERPDINGKAEIASLDPKDCGTGIGCFRYPAGCEYSNCEHFLLWNDTGEMVKFTRAAKTIANETGSNPWTAVGFSNDTSMPDTPVVDCIHWSDKFIIQSSYNPAYRNQVLNQTELGLVNGTSSGSLKEGLLECSFTKYKTVSANNSEANFVANLTEPNQFYLLLPIGPTNTTTGLKEKHVKKIISSTTVSFSERPNVNADSPAKKLDPNDCGSSIGCFRYPSGCDYSDCEHFLMWNDTGEMVNFTIAAKIDMNETGSSFWTAVGFSNNTHMPATPVVDCIYWEDRFVVQASYNPEYYNEVLNNTQLGLVNGTLSGSLVEDNFLECSFTKYKTVPANNSEAKYVASLIEPNRFYLLMPTGPTNHTTGIKEKHVEKIISNVTVSFSERPNINGASPQALDPKDCGTKIGCIRFPANCEVDECSNMLLWNDTGEDTVKFTISAEISPGNGGSASVWTAIGLSDDQQMPNTPVVDCIYWAEHQSFLIQASYNKPGVHANEVLQQAELGIVPGSYHGSYRDNILSCTFTKYKTMDSSNSEAHKVANLSTPHYIFLAVGDADSSGTKQKHSKEPVKSPNTVNFAQRIDIGADHEDMRKARAHGILMVLAWVLFAATGTAIARYLKSFESFLTSTALCGAQLWFRIHQLLMTLTLVCTLSGFVLIFLQVKYFYTDNMLHPIIGIIVALLVILNPILGVFRPGKEADNRYMFNWTHGFIGFTSSILAAVNICLGVQFEAMNLPRWMFWVAVAFLVSRCFVDIILTLCARIVSSNRVEDVTYVKLSEVGVTADQWKSWTFTRVVLAVYFPTVWGLGLALIVGLIGATN